MTLERIHIDVYFKSYAVRLHFVLDFQSRDRNCILRYIFCDHRKQSSVTIMIPFRCVFPRVMDAESFPYYSNGNIIEVQYCDSSLFSNEIYATTLKCTRTFICPWPVFDLTLTWPLRDLDLTLIWHCRDLKLIFTWPWPCLWLWFYLDMT